MTTATGQMPQRSLLIHVSEKKRHGHVQRAVWERIMAALAEAGVELLAEGGSFGADVRWIAPRNRRESG